MIIRFSTFNTNIGMRCFYALLSAHNALTKTDAREASQAYSSSVEFGLVWC